MANCNFPTCTAHAEKNGYCVRHGKYAPKSAGKTEPAQETKKKFQRFRPVSKKLAAKERQYKKIVVELLTESNLCELKTPECTGVAQGLHHMKGRGVHLLNRKFLKRACNACNGYVERHPAYALEHGLSVSRHKKEG